MYNFNLKTKENILLLHRYFLNVKLKQNIKLFIKSGFKNLVKTKPKPQKTVHKGQRNKWQILIENLYKE